MANNQTQMKAAGTSAKQVLSEIEETDNEQKRPYVEDADESSVCNEKIATTRRQPSAPVEDSSDYYVLRSKFHARYKKPGKLEFQKVNNQLTQDIRRKSNVRHDSNTMTCNSAPHYLPHHPYPMMYSPYPPNSTAQPHFYTHEGMPMYVPTYAQHPDVSRETQTSNAHPCYPPHPVSSEVCSNQDDENQRENNEEKREKTEYYKFDQGEDDYLYTTDRAPLLISDQANELTFQKSTKFWAEVFGTINIGVTFILCFFLQLYRFLLYSLIRSTIGGILQLTSDYCLKPLLATVFNGFIQPLFLFMKNIFSALWSCCEPVAEMILGFFVPFIECFRVIRVVDVYNNTGVLRAREAKKEKNQTETV